MIYLLYWLIGFEHILAGLQLMIGWVIPSVPETVKSRQQVQNEVAESIMIKALTQDKRRGRHRHRGRGGRGEESTKVTESAILDYSKRKKDL